MLKHAPIRIKMIIIYVTMTVFTVPFMLVAINFLTQMHSGQEEIYNHMAETAALLKFERELAAGRDASDQLADFGALIDQSDADTAAYLDRIQKAYSSYKNGGDRGVFTVIDEAVGHFQGKDTAILQQGDKTLRMFIWFCPILLVAYVLVTLRCGRYIATSVAQPAGTLAQAARELALGNIEVDFIHDSRDEIGRLAKQLHLIVEENRKQAEILACIAEGDFSRSIEIRSEKDVVNTAIDTLVKNNSGLISEIRGAVEQVATGSMHIAAGAQSLSAGSAEQAASIDDFMTSLTSVRGKTGQNASAAEQAVDIAVRAGERMAEGIKSMADTREAMSAIEESSKNINKVIKVIEDIAFQTNILALNAAVEAAHAGQHGKGFAVVAEEVRDLAGKSSAAAKETAELIEGSAKRVIEGTKLVEKTESDLAAVGELAGENHKLNMQIAADAKEQAELIASLTESMEQISTVVQNNSAVAEQSAASAQEISGQSLTLSGLVSRYRLSEEEALPPAEPQMALPENTGYGRF